MDIKVGRNWGLFAAGIALILIGFVLLMVPGLTLVSIAVIAGCMFLAAGIVDAWAYFKYRRAEGLSAWALAYAACDIILGVLFIRAVPGLLPSGPRRAVGRLRRVAAPGAGDSRPQPLAHSGHSRSVRVRPRCSGSSWRAHSASTATLARRPGG